MSILDKIDDSKWGRRDAVVSREVETRKEFDFVPSSPADTDPETKLVTFPYPYQNGRLHLGHAYTITKVDFYANYLRKNNFKVLFPFAFHGTGMPIVTCADKLKDELENPAKYKALKKEAEEKDETYLTQTDILKMMDVTDENIPKFIDPYFWLEYWPEVAKQDLKLMGVSTDLTRSFVTTSLNSYYDSFIRWQFDKLNKARHLVFGKKLVIYSEKDGQPCADHDRSKGEEVEPQETTLIVLPVVGELKYVSNVSLLASTFRPETMYGQTNVWIDKRGTYALGKYKGKHYVARAETFRNLCNQIPGWTLENIEFITGSELLGTMVQPPCSWHNTPVPVLHMPKVSMHKGTGIVTSVPSDSPTDYTYWKAAVEKGDCPTTELPSFIQVEDKTQMAAQLCEESKLEPGNDKLLQEIHDTVYKNSFHKGVMIQGPYTGQPVSKAKESAKQDMILANTAMTYWEPESEVISRSGDVCGVANVDQWFINYGEESWKEQVREHAKSMKFNNQTAHRDFTKRIETISMWPCSRSYGLGTQLLDTEYVIDSLSDSTIYMAFYTVAHLITEIPAGKITPAFWDYIFTDVELPDEAAEYAELMLEMKQQFNHWYPVALRVSGKDLINNHLVMALFNHAAIWPGKPHLWPQAYFVNGHILLNGEKMSKSKGNFVTLQQAVKKFSADATRLMLAEAGESMDDANFNTTVAESIILTLTTERDYLLDVEKSLLTAEDTPYTTWDTIFETCMDVMVQKATRFMEEGNYRAALKSCWYELHKARDNYRVMVERSIIPFNRKVLSRYLELSINLIEPICPHWAAELRKELNKSGISVTTAWPTPLRDIDSKSEWTLNTFSRIVNDSLHAINKKAAKMKTKASTIRVQIKLRHAGFARETLEYIRTATDGATDFEVKKFIKQTLSQPQFKTASKKIKGKMASFIAQIRSNVREYGVEWYEWVLTDTTVTSLVIEWMEKIAKELAIVSVDSVNIQEINPEEPTHIGEALGSIQ